MTGQTQKQETILAAFFWGMRFGEEMISAIQRHAPPHWSVIPMHYLREVRLRFEKLPFSAVIADLHTPEDVAVGEAMGVPLVDASGTCSSAQASIIASDEHAVGALAAETFAEASKRTRPVFLGYRDHRYSEQRKEGFVQALATQGVTKTLILETDWNTAGELESEWDRVATQVQALPEGTPIFACSDVRAIYLRDFAQRRGIPEIFTGKYLLGVDADRKLMTVHGLHFPSIQLDYDQLALAAIDHLRRQIIDPGTSREDRAIPPLGVAEPMRGSETTDPLVEKAQTLIRAELSQGLTVQELVERLHVSHSTLERRFKRSLGKTPREWIQDQRFERAAELVRDTQLSFVEIAAIVGYDEQRRLTQLFRARTGGTPSAYRERQGGPSSVA